MSKKAKEMFVFGSHILANFQIDLLRDEKCRAGWHTLFGIRVSQSEKVLHEENLLQMCFEGAFDSTRDDELVVRVVQRFAKESSFRTGIYHDVYQGTFKFYIEGHKLIVNFHDTDVSGTIKFHWDFDLH
jgi:hypothetical protein